MKLATGMEKVKECQEKALTFAIQLSDRKVQGMSNWNLGTAFHPLGECQKAKDYQEKALAFAIEISDTEEKKQATGKEKVGVTGASEPLITSDTREWERQTTNN
ncbi:hypothetical protein pdam_00015079 [Pocillopora damicornis]|uniref:Uncharacterized protein n=1 Tax=Pocillopora damicornis TaxID=46731 RepID=A0A3M6UMP8_POCDA|nr:hypothetical protein pdam_00015079 [Pocillopora damicornis]